MFAALENVIESIVFGPHRRKLNKYLEDATMDSVLEDLRKAMMPRLRRGRDNLTIFDSHVAEDTSGGERYWNEESLRRYLETSHPGSSISRAQTKLLWRCFYSYAYHPFPQAPIDREIVHAAAFQRATALLVYGQTSFLGTQDNGAYFWRLDDQAFFYKASFKRIFRSIGTRYNTSKSMPNSNDDVASILDDTLDVLSTTQPYDINVSPPPDQVKATAYRLLGEALDQTSSQTSREDLTTFFDLLLQSNLCHFDRLDRTGPSLANILVSGLADKEWQYLTSEQVHMAMSLLPNIHLSFHQLWAALFQPPNVEHRPVKSVEVEYASQHVLAAISLFLPQPGKPSLDPWTSIIPRVMPRTFESCNQDGQDPNDLTVTNLIKVLARDARPYVVLITGDQDAGIPKVVIGAYFPSPLWLDDSATGEKRKCKAGHSHLLFQLEPKLRILQWTVPEVALLDMFTLKQDGSNEYVSLLDTIPEASVEMEARSSKAYKIGGPGKEDGGLCIDPETKIATLSSGSSGTRSEDDIPWYKDLCVKDDENRGEGTTKQTWEVQTKISRLEVFSVSNRIDLDLASGGMTRVKDHARDIQEAKGQVKIEGDALKKRIQGFGYVPT